MTIAFLSNVLNIHQIAIADELYKLSKHNYWFIAFKPSSLDLLKGGTDEFNNRPYIIKAYESNESWNRTVEITKNVDVLIYGEAPLSLIKMRLMHNKLTFQYSERWLKKGLINILSPRLLKQQWFYYTCFHNKPLYILCASAYASYDYNILHSFKNKCFKWGYFIKPSFFDMNLNIEKKRMSPTIKILWVARFIPFKHPEYMVHLASFLRSKNIKFSIDMIGNGREFLKTKKQIESQKLSDCIHLLGTLSNEKVIEEMKSHHIFCFTSDKKEGWGTVLNEAMSCGCCPVASIEAGATRFLLKNYKNGLYFNGKIENDLFNKVLWLINNLDARESMSISAYTTIREEWSPHEAALRFIKLSESLLHNKNFEEKDGPCSIAEIINDKTYEKKYFVPN